MVVRGREAPKSKVEMVPGFEEASTNQVLRLILNVEGQEKEGKTHFSLTAPGPIALIDMDTGLEGVVSKFLKEKKIYVASFNYRDATNPDEWQAEWKKLKTCVLDALSSKNIRSLVWDSCTEGWEMMRMAAFGKLAQVKPHHYAPVNAEFRDLLRKGYDSNKNLILIHKQKKSYVDEKWTGGYERAGFSDIGYAVQANIISWRITSLDEQYGKKRDDEYKGFGLTVRDCRQVPELASLEILEPLNTFPQLAQMVFPESDESDWE
jgi:hypothetical protein